jgi:hypothetical protein
VHEYKCPFKCVVDIFVDRIYDTMSFCMLSPQTEVAVPYFVTVYSKRFENLIKHDETNPNRLQIYLPGISFKALSYIIFTTDGGAAFLKLQYRSQCLTEYGFLRISSS